jgi:multicomponent Na+:H+ antiporter subunit G
MIEQISEGLLWAGGILAVIGAIGMLRFPDFYTRSHAATVITSGGFVLALFGILAASRLDVYFFKIMIVLIASLVTNPTATHALADAAYSLGIKPAKLAGDESGMAWRKDDS